MEPGKLTLEFVKSKLLDQEMRRQNRYGYDGAFNSGKFRGKRNQLGGRNYSNHDGQVFKCYHCGKPRPRWSKCRWRQPMGQANRADREESDGIVFLGSTAHFSSLTDDGSM